MTTETDCNFTAQQYLSKYGKEEAIKLLEKMAQLKNDEAECLKNQAAKYHNAANMLKESGV
jgi:hypothetical protein